MKARWNLENRVFNNLKNNANLDHCFVHGGNAVKAVLHLMFIASGFGVTTKKQHTKAFFNAFLHVSNSQLFHGFAYQYKL